MTVDAVDEPFRAPSSPSASEGDTLLGVPLPAPCTFTTGRNIDILWMGPDEYLVYPSFHVKAPTWRPSFHVKAPFWPWWMCRRSATSCG